MQLSLVCATAGRVAELERLLHSLQAQGFRDFELVIVDQNSDNRVSRVVASVRPTFLVRHVALSSPGLCRALNAGLAQAQGEIVGFPDDDCWYSTDLLDKLSALFSAHPHWDGITVPAADEDGKPSIARWATHPGRLTKSNLGMRGCCTTMFYRRHVCENIGSFDETIGGADNLLSPGSDVDYLHRVLRAGFDIEYQPQLSVGHPQTLPAAAMDENGKRKRYAYGYGEGSIARKYSVPLWYVAGIVVFPLTRAIKQAVCGHRHQAFQEWLTFRGRLDGWFRVQPGAWPE